MDLDEILDTIVSYDPTKKWEVLIYQLVFSSLRNFCIKRVINDTEVDWDNLYELCQHCDPSFKKHLIDLFDPEHFNEIEDVELLEVFCKQFIESLDVIIQNELLENEFIHFLDVTLFEYFAKVLDGTDVYIFPRNIDDTLHEDVFLAFKGSSSSQPSLLLSEQYELLDEIDVDTEYFKKKSLSHALSLKKTGFLKTLKHTRVSLTNTRKNRAS